ncbi:efflux RND transporter periplasmic adaptor subunit [Saccharicrinis sp. FJH54]|uniref:efflux RND transporter periplasmic adaptor subunit n=1 Tax=Saccharicrinis sp. FJH54 TaxID=3344665 RepID=UPI0035D429B2
MKIVKIAFGVIIGLLFIWTFYFLYQKSQKPPVQYQIKKPEIGNIINKTVATGSVVPRQEIQIKPQISGIIDEIYVEPGDHVEKEQVIARVKIIPDMVNLNSAESRVKQADIKLNDAKLDYDRQKELYDREVISKSEFQKVVTSFNAAKEELAAAENNLQLIKEGVIKDYANASNTLIRATITGMVLDVPVKEGNSVIQANTFNDGTTIATIADMSDMIFEGKIDETEVGKIRSGMDLMLTIGAIEEKKFDAKLTYVAPKGVEENGAIQFEIKADVKLNDKDFVRAGYSANADIVLDKKDSVMTIDESLVRFENDTAYVEIFKGNEDGRQMFEKKEIKTGLSDGIKIQVLSGLTLDDEIKGEKELAKKDKPTTEEI